MQRLVFLRLWIFIPILMFQAQGSALQTATVQTKACAHRGDLKVAPENTLPAIHSAVQKGAHQIEVDLQLTRDGVLILMHDETIDRTTNGRGRVSEKTYAELKNLDAGRWFGARFAETRIPTFEQALKAIPPFILCNCHIKGSPEVARKAAEAVKELDRLDHCFLAATIDQAKAAKNAVPEIMICNMSRQTGPGSSYADATIEMGCEFIQLLGPKTELKPLVEKLHRNRVTVNFFHGSSREEIKQLVEAGVDYILTDHLDLCLEVLSEYGVRPAGL